MNIRIKSAAIILATLSSATATASTLTTDISNDAFKVEIATGNFAKDTHFAASAMHNDDTDVNLFTGTAAVVGNISRQPNFTAGLGGRLYYADTNGDDMQALGLGGFAKYRIPEIQGLSLQGELFYAPGIVASDELDNQFELGLRANYQLLPNGAVYAGYRHIKADIENGGEFVLDNGFHLGFEFSF
ncbi:YfaZ family outer membrane protein [Gayadomonas joobiniege]|uniref:YfaZ family outer membrane protein n=1 Tax=Gayadomonas joobiniege TaxID=1234606 RepID=UPI00036C2E1A|nr:YfaZ family outer membrane protein [Gayadomonas joobiniege]